MNEPKDSLAHLSQRLAEFAAERDWGRFHAPKNLASALVVEAAELLEPFQWMTEEQSRALNADQREAVLRAFARGDGSRSTPGSGLGLTVVQQVLKRVGGTLSFDGQAGRWVVLVQLHRNPPEHL